MSLSTGPVATSDVHFLSTSSCGGSSTNVVKPFRGSRSGLGGLIPPTSTEDYETLWLPAAHSVCTRLLQIAFTTPPSRILAQLPFQNLSPDSGAFLTAMSKTSEYWANFFPWLCPAAMWTSNFETHGAMHRKEPVWPTWVQQVHPTRTHTYQ